MHHAIEVQDFLVGAIFGVGFLLTVGFLRRDRPLYISILPALILATFCVMQAHSALTPILPKFPADTFDERLYFEDVSLGFEPSMWLQHVIGYGLIGRILEFVYEGWALGIGLACGVALWGGKRRFSVVMVFVLSVVFGLICYYVVPACGPGYLRGGAFLTAPYTAASTPDVAPVPVDMDDHYQRNCMPSLHMTWALLVALLCKDHRRWRWFGWPFALLTGIAAMWNGEHYIVDIVAAFPFAFALYHACGLQKVDRIPRVALSTSAFSLWILIVRNDPREFWIHPVVCWSFAMLIVSSVLYDALGGPLWPAVKQPLAEIAKAEAP